MLHLRSYNLFERHSMLLFIDSVRDAAAKWIAKVVDARDAERSLIAQ